MILPDAAIAYQSRPGPNPPVVIVEANVGNGETAMIVPPEPVTRFQFSSRLF
jgi:hypothetical protein